MRKELKALTYSEKKTSTVYSNYLETQWYQSCTNKAIDISITFCGSFETFKQFYLQSQVQDL